MAFHGLTNHVRDNITSELLLISKDNPTTLMMHKPSQLNILNRIQRTIAFGNVKHQVFKELFFNRVDFFVRYHSNGKEINNGLFFFLLIGDQQVPW